MLRVNYQMSFDASRLKGCRHLFYNRLFASHSTHSTRTRARYWVEMISARIFLTQRRSSLLMPTLRTRCPIICAHCLIICCIGFACLSCCCLHLFYVFGMEEVCLSIIIVSRRNRMIDIMWEKEFGTVHLVETQK